MRERVIKLSLSVTFHGPFKGPFNSAFYVKRTTQLIVLPSCFFRAIVPFLVAFVNVLVSATVHIFRAYIHSFRTETPPI